MLIIGHRGSSHSAPENTLAGFQAALDAQVDSIEFDVRTTADGVPVIAHNKRLHGKWISQTDFADLHPRKADLITLDQALRFLKGKSLIIIEIKRRTELAPILTCLKEHLRSGWQPADMQIASFSYSTLKTIKKELPDITLVINEEWSGVRAARRATKLGTKYITMNQLWLYSGFIKSVSARGYKLSAFTINDPKKAERWARHGLFAVITDFPSKFSGKKR